jgi:hypothetical protein
MGCVKSRWGRVEGVRGLGWQIEEAGDLGVGKSVKSDVHNTFVNPDLGGMEHPS